MLLILHPYPTGRREPFCVQPSPWIFWNSALLVLSSQPPRSLSPSFTFILSSQIPTLCPCISQLSSQGTSLSALNLLLGLWIFFNVWFLQPPHYFTSSYYTPAIEGLCSCFPILEAVTSCQFSAHLATWYCLLPPIPFYLWDNSLSLLLVEHPRHHL